MILGMDCFQYDVLSLIELIETRPALWDRTDDRYKDKSLKRTAWKEICTFFLPTFDQLKANRQKEIGECLITKWNNIRDAFVRSLKVKNGETKKPYVYHDQLQFLYKVVGPDTSLPIGSPKVIKNYTKLENDTSTITRKRKYRYSFESDKNSGSKTFCDRESKVTGPIDEDEAFFKSILSSVRSFPQDDKIDFRIDVMALVKKYRNNSKANSAQADASMLVQSADGKNCMVSTTPLTENNCSMPNV